MKKIPLGKHEPVFVVAELSANHNGSLETAIETVRAAKRAGADAIKLQTYTADTITLNSTREDFKLKQGTIWDGRYLYDLYQEAHTPWEWHPSLFRVAEEEGLFCFSSPFDRTAVDFLETFDPPAYKIASFEITDIPLIEYVASKGRPVIISTGIAGKDDIQLALDTCKDQNNNNITLLKCTSSYPAPLDNLNLVMIPEMARRFGVLTGLSDHTSGITAPVVAVALGARLIEKHFMLDKSISGVDSSFSLDVTEFSEMVQKVRDAEKVMGKVDFELTEKQMQSRQFSRSIYAIRDISEGEVFSEENIKSIRPGFGLHPKFLNEILGKRAARNIYFGESLNWDLIVR